MFVEETPLQHVRANVGCHVGSLDALTVVTNDRSLNFVIIMTFTTWEKLKLSSCAFSRKIQIY